MADGAEARPIPPRFWWLRRLSIAGGALLVFLVLLRLWWGWEAQRRLNAAIEEWRADSEPVSVRTFDAELDAVPDEDNAALLYMQAADKMVAATDAGVNIGDLVDDLALLATKTADVVELMERNAEALRLLREARGRSRIAWPARFADPPGVMFPLSEQRVLAKLIWLTARHDVQAGRTTAAVERVRDGISHGRALAAHPTVLLGLVGWACEDLTRSVIEQDGRQLVADSICGPMPADGLDRPAGLRDLVDELLDEAPGRKSTRQMYLGERAELHYQLEPNRLDAYLAPPWGPNAGLPVLSVVQPSLHPALVLDVRREMSLWTIASDAATDSRFPSAADRFGPARSPATLVGAVAMPLSVGPWQGGGFQQRIAQLFFGGLARSRMAAVALAVHAFERDNGYRPMALQQLVPEYLSELPEDPFAHTSRPFGYRPDEPQPYLYSVGANGVDDRGLRGRGVTSPTGDVRFYLDPEPMASLPSGVSSGPQAGEDDEDVNDDERKADDE